MAVPPREVPEGLSAEEYYRLGVEYKSMGWTEQARDALLLAQETDPESETAIRARRFLKTKLPRFPVPLLAEQKNIEGFNQMATGNSDAAKQTFLELIADFPDFEWPYGNLSVLYLQESKTEEAKNLLVRALEINPEYVNGWLHMAAAKGMDGDFRGAKECVKRALEADPTDSASLAMKEALDSL
ncbi:MAG TPA: tetratricopeptide repeat protein [Candidatus Obscuribacterales bacterium]